MAYELLYKVYDSLMSHVPYDRFINVVKEYADKNAVLLDLACGTGKVLVPLVEEGYLIDGLDLSEEMLMVTRDKLQTKHLSSSLHLGRMEELKVNSYYQLVYCFLDSINYLTNIIDIDNTFQGVFDALVQDGYFLFDVPDQNYIKKMFSNYCFVDEMEDSLYIWQTNTQKHNQILTVYHQLTFFLPKTNHLYVKKQEFHTQVIFPLNTYIELLQQNGFEIVNIIDDFLLDGSKRKLIVSKKCRS